MTTATIQGYFADIADVPSAGTVTAESTLTPLFVSFSGTWKQVRHGTFTVAVNGSTGLWSFALPCQDVCYPATVQWRLTMPDGVVWQGALITGGTIDLYTLVSDHDWSQGT